MVDNLSHMFLADLDQDLESIGILLQSDEQVTGSMEFSDYFTNLQRSQHIKHDDSGEVTPISERSKIEVLTNNIPVARNSSLYYDITVKDDTDSTVSDEVLQQTPLDMCETASVTTNADDTDVFLQGSITPTSSDLSTIDNSYKHVLHTVKTTKLGHSDNLVPFDSSSSKMGQNTGTSTKQMKLFEKDTKSNTYKIGPDKWCASNKVFLDMSKAKDTSKEFCKQNACTKPGAVVVKACYIEPPRISRVSKSLDGKSQASQSLLNIAAIPRRASDGVPLTSRSVNGQADNLQCGKKNVSSEDCSPEKSSYKRPQFVTHLSHPGVLKTSRNISEFKKSSLSNDNIQSRFTTTMVNETDILTEISVRASQENTPAVKNITLTKTNPNNL